MCTCRHEHTHDMAPEGKDKGWKPSVLLTRGDSLSGLGESAPEAQGWTFWKHISPSHRPSLQESIRISSKHALCGVQGGAGRYPPYTLTLTYTHPIHTHHTCSAHMRVHTGSHPHEFIHMSSHTHITHTLTLMLMLTHPHTPTLTQSHLLLHTTHSHTQTEHGAAV